MKEDYERAHAAAFFDELGEGEWARFADGRTPPQSLELHIDALRRFVDRHDLQPLGFGLLRRRRARPQADGNVLRPRVAQVQRVGMALAAVADDGNLLVLDEIDVAIAIVVDAHSRFPPVLELRGTYAS